MIRSLAKENDNLYVLEETLTEQWLIKYYPNGVAEIQDRIRKHFGPLRRELMPPMIFEGLQEKMFQDVLKRTEGIVNVNPADAQQFYDGFISNFFLKAYKQQSLTDYLAEHSGIQDQHAPQDVANKTEAIASAVKNNPKLIKIPMPNNMLNGKWYSETALANCSALCFSKDAEYFDYVKLGVEPRLNKEIGMVRVDLACQTPRETFLIEIKTGTSAYSQDKMKKQLTFAAHFMHHNFTDHATLIGITYSKDNDKVTFKHYRFNNKNNGIMFYEHGYFNFKMPETISTD